SAQADVPGTRASNGQSRYSIGLGHSQPGSGDLFMTVLFAFLHHLAAFTLVSVIAIEFVLLRGELTQWSARRLQVADMILGIAATVLLLVGLARVFWFEKGAAYYFHNHAFLTKFSLFIIVALLSIVPTVQFLSWRKTVKQ